MKLLRALSVLSCMALVLASFPAHAQITSAVAYQKIVDTFDASDPANFASSLPHSNFTVGPLGINFNTTNSQSTLLFGFLNSPTFFNQANGFDVVATASRTEILMSGFATLVAGPNSFVVGHDSGVVLFFPAFGTVVNAPGPSAFSLSPFTVNAPSAGSYAFSLEYEDDVNGPANLDFTVNSTPITSGPSNATPEPSGFILLGSGLLGAVGMVRRRLAA